MLSQECRPKMFKEVAGQNLSKKLLKSIIKNKDNAPHSIILQGPFGCGKCINGDTRVFTEKGYLKIKDLYYNPKEGFNDFKILVKSDVGWEYTSHFYYEKNCKVNYLKLSNGSIMNGTDNHKVNVLTDTGVKLISIKDIKKGDYIALSKEVCEKGYHDVELGFLLGLLCGDSNYNKIFSFENSSFELVEYVKNKLNINSKIETIKDSYYRVRTKKIPFLVSKYFEDDLSKNKRVPEIAFSMDFTSRLAFIHGYLITEGYISKSRGAIEFSTLSKEFTKDIFNILTSLGINCYLSEKKKKVKYKNSSRFIYVYKTVVYKNKHNYDILRLYKNKFTREIEEVKENKNTRNILRITKELREAILSLKGHKKDFISRTKQNVREGVNITERTLEKLYTVTGLDIFKKYLNYKYVQVENITVQIEDVYDLTVPGSHHFYAQGVLNHNTTQARIFAKAINCPNSKNQEPCLRDDCPICSQDLDSSNFYVEYDSSVVGNVSKIRELRDTFYYTTQNIYKVIVLDECHLCSSSALSALLKVIEEAPKNVFFIFATTHIDKLLPTIRSRSLEIRVETVSIKDIVNNLKNICKIRNITIDDKTLELIASKSKGHMRNAHMLLDNYLLLGEEDFKTSLISSREALLQYLISIIKHDKELLFKSISLIETFPIANVYEDFQILLRDITRRMVEPKDDIETKIYKSMSSKYLKFLKAFSSEYIKVSFQNEISATTALMALYQQFTTQNTSNTSSNRRTVRTK